MDEKFNAYMEAEKKAAEYARGLNTAKTAEEQAEVYTKYLAWIVLAEKLYSESENE